MESVISDDGRWIILLYSETGDDSYNETWFVLNLIPNPGKGHFVTEDWRPISLLNVDSNIIAQVYGKEFGRKTE